MYDVQVDVEVGYVECRSPLVRPAESPIQASDKAQRLSVAVREPLDYPYDTLPDLLPALTPDALARSAQDVVHSRASKVFNLRLIRPSPDLLEHGVDFSGQLPDPLAERGFPLTRQRKAFIRPGRERLVICFLVVADIAGLEGIDLVQEALELRLGLFVQNGVDVRPEKRDLVGDTRVLVLKRLKR